MDYNNFTSLSAGVGVGFGSITGLTLAHDFSIAVTGHSINEVLALGAGVGALKGMFYIGGIGSFIPDIVNRYVGRHDDFVLVLPKFAKAAVASAAITTGGLYATQDRGTPEIFFTFSPESVVTFEKSHNDL